MVLGMKLDPYFTSYIKSLLKVNQGPKVRANTNRTLETTWGEGFMTLDSALISCV